MFELMPDEFIRADECVSSINLNEILNAQLDIKERAKVSNQRKKKLMLPMDSKEELLPFSYSSLASKARKYLGSANSMASLNKKSEKSTRPSSLIYEANKLWGLRRAEVPTLGKVVD